MEDDDIEVQLSEPMRRAWRTDGSRSAVFRRGQTVVRESGPWAKTVHGLLRHLEDTGFTGSPRVVGSGFDPDGRETLSYIEGEIIHPGPWSLEGAAAVGTLIKDLHQATSTFKAPKEALWPPWFGRELGGPDRVISHCDFAPWNVIARDGLPVALIDWEYAGPVDPVIELAQACWLNVGLHSDDVAERNGFPSVEVRARQLRAMVDAYELPRTQRAGFIDLMIEFVVHDTAEQANEAGVTPDTTDSEALWGLAWRARAAAWLYRNRKTLHDAL